MPQLDKFTYFTQFFWFLVPFLTCIAANSLFLFLGSEEKAIMLDGLNLVIVGIVFLGLIFLFRLFYFHLHQRYGSRVVCFLSLSFLLFTSLFLYCIRIYVISNISVFFSDVLAVFMGTCAVSGSGGEMHPHSEKASSSEVGPSNPGPNRDETGPSSIQQSPADSLIGHASSESDSDKEDFFSPPQSLSAASSSSTSTPGIDSAPNNGENEEHYSFSYIKPGGATHEAMKEDYLLPIVRRKFEEWESMGKIDGDHINKSNEALAQALNLSFIQTQEEAERLVKELIELDWPKLETAPAGASYAGLWDLLKENCRKT